MSRSTSRNWCRDHGRARKGVDFQEGRAGVRLCEERAPLIQADATQLRQLVMNLIMNAAEAIGDTGGSVTVRTGVVDADSALLAEMLHEEDVAEGLYEFLEVADTGCGMDTETQAKMFDPFFTTKFTGRGLGLAAVQGIVRGHRGAFQVRSAPGQGTCFRVLFPASKQPLVRRIAEEPTSAMPYRTGTVLVVDDEDLVRLVAQQILERAGFTVRTADGGRAALEAFREHHEQIDAVLLDLTMPDLGGEESCTEKCGASGPPCRSLFSVGTTKSTSRSASPGSGQWSFWQSPTRTPTSSRRSAPPLQRTRQMRDDFCGLAHAERLHPPCVGAVARLQ